MVETVITFGTYDLLHIGHLRLLNRASRYGVRLVVGVSSDELNFAKKGKYPVYCQEDRMEIISGLRCVDQVFLEESLELKKAYIREYNANVLIMGDDWAGRFDCFSSECKVVYLERTPDISTSEVISDIYADSEK